MNKQTEKRSKAIGLLMDYLDDKTNDKEKATLYVQAHFNCNKRTALEYLRVAQFKLDSNIPK